MMVLSIDTANTFVGQGGYGFLSPLNDQQSGILLDIPSIILFFVSFGFGFREKTRLTSLLLVAGGALLAVSKIVEPTMGLNLFFGSSTPSSIYRSDPNGFCHNGTRCS